MNKEQVIRDLCLIFGVFVSESARIKAVFDIAYTELNGNVFQAREEAARKYLTEIIDDMFEGKENE